MIGEFCFVNVRYRARLWSSSRARVAGEAGGGVAIALGSPSPRGTRRVNERLTVDAFFVVNSSNGQEKG